MLPFVRSPVKQNKLCLPERRDGFVLFLERLFHSFITTRRCLGCPMVDAPSSVPAAADQVEESLHVLNYMAKKLVTNNAIHFVP